MVQFARENVQVFALDGKSCGVTKFPEVFTAPIRTDVVAHVHRDMNKNRRQPYAVSRQAGTQTSAESWGTGRAVARIPRVGGGGTHRSGQGAFGNMCRGGRMFTPTKTYRRWHRHINLKQRQFAILSAIAATSLTALVTGRGHRIATVEEIPLVVTDEIESIKTTKEAIALLKSTGAYRDVERVISSKKIRAGKGKMRNRRYVIRKGPLVIYNKDLGIQKSFRNIPGIDLCCVTRLNLLQLAPGGQVGRFVIWTKSAFDQLDTIYDKLPHGILTNTDITRIINSTEVQSSLRDKRLDFKPIPRKIICNREVLQKLNPYSKA